MGALGLGLVLAAGPWPVSAQQSPVWNGPRVLELLERGTATRQAAALDDLLAYTADARGYVYYFLDRQDTEERNLIKTDQLAVRLFWKAPYFTRQHILGRRDERRMPTSIRYHLDHLTVVQENFGDVIRVGDGDEVASVLHPLAPGAGVWYEFLLADSVTVAFAGGIEPVRVYEVLVRPRDPGQPGYVGSVFLDQESAAIVRMNFTFTPASYVDPQLDYIRVSLDNALWDHRYWLPYRQSVEIRRESPYLDLPVGSIIRGRWEIGGYDFDADLPDAFFVGPRIMRRNDEALRAFPFERDLYAQIDEEGLDPTAELIDIQAEAGRLVRGRYLSGLRRLRLAMPPVSEAVRYNRAEGWVTQGGFSVRATDRLHLGALLGYSYAQDRPVGRLRIGLEDPARVGTLGIDLFLREPRDIGPVPGSSRIMNTLSSLFRQSDWTDPYFATGARARGSRSLGLVSVHAEVRYERQRNARVAVGADPVDPAWRPVRVIDEGDLAAVRLSASAGNPNRLLGEAGATLGSFDGATYREATLHFTAARRWLQHGLELRSTLDAATVSGGAPLQSLYLLGGRETLPGYDYRSLVGDAFWLLRAEGSRKLLGPWLRIRGVGAVGRTRLSSARVPESWDARLPRITRFSAGLGLALAWDLVQLDLVRGLNGGSWEIVLDLNRRFRDLL